MGTAYQARPTEIMHAELMRLFHEHRAKEVGGNVSVMIHGGDMASMIVKAKNIANKQSLQAEANTRHDMGLMLGALIGLKECVDDGKRKDIQEIIDLVESHA